MMINNDKSEKSNYLPDVKKFPEVGFYLVVSHLVHLSRPVPGQTAAQMGDIVSLIVTRVALHW